MIEYKNVKQLVIKGSFEENWLKRFERARNLKFGIGTKLLNIPAPIDANSKTLYAAIFVEWLLSTHSPSNSYIIIKISNASHKVTIGYVSPSSHLEGPATEIVRWFIAPEAPLIKVFPEKWKVRQSEPIVRRLKDVKTKPPYIYAKYSSASYEIFTSPYIDEVAAYLKKYNIPFGFKK